MDWSGCPLVESRADKVSGVPLLKGTRLPADAVLDNFRSGLSVAEISEQFDVPEPSVRKLLSYASEMSVANSVRP